IIKTDDPSCAREIAVFTAVVVLPSPGWPLVIRIVFGGFSVDESKTEVRSTLYASATDERESSANNRSALNTALACNESPPCCWPEPLEAALSARRFRPPIAGMTLRAGNWV